MPLSAKTLILACAGAALTAVLALSLAATRAPRAPARFGHIIHVLRPRRKDSVNQTANWFGYAQGRIEQGGTQFHSISADWTVPTAHQHVRGQAEYSATWIGIGGGCVDADCTVIDRTLLQTGSEQDVDSSGQAIYTAWFEPIPSPAYTIRVRIRPGDRIHASIVETPRGSETWLITFRDLTRHTGERLEGHYPSTYATAEWIEEPPFLITSSGSGFAYLPNLSRIPFDHAKTNGHPPKLRPSEEVQVIDGSGRVIATPSRPNPQRDGFRECTWTTRCPAPPG